eukprot:TRINITY_DN25860_c0_g1_i1.p1 TRINITY_DN25860_c0_g1~~TRINITY_DN25860_c0_g1_i1.p1  ORF type:complete len:139 (-),score=22.17 TRINITY_DN25860_c0_g1_i1:53-469(-)
MMDLEEKRAITRERALEFKSRENLDGFIETSAKDGTNVQDLFVRTAKMLFLQQQRRQSLHLSSTPKLDSDQQGKVIIDNKIGTKHKRGCACQQFFCIILKLSLIHISEPTRPLYISYAVFCLKKKKKTNHLVSIFITR